MLSILIIIFAILMYIYRKNIFIHFTCAILMILYDILFANILQFEKMNMYTEIYKCERTIESEIENLDSAGSDIIIEYQKIEKHIDEYHDMVERYNENERKKKFLFFICNEYTELVYWEVI